MPYRKRGGADDRAHAVALLRLVPRPQVDVNRQCGYGPATSLGRHPHAVAQLLVAPDKKKKAATAAGRTENDAQQRRGT